MGNAVADTGMSQEGIVSTLRKRLRAIAMGCNF